MLATHGAGAFNGHQQAALDADFDSTVRTKIFSVRMPTQLAVTNARLTPGNKARSCA